jgi:hypothetical protein
VQECEELGLTGRLPSAVPTLDQQAGARVRIVAVRLLVES